MKRSLTAALCLLFFMSFSNSQDHTFGFTIGMNSSTLSNSKLKDVSSFTGARFGFFRDFTLSPDYSLQTGAEYVHRGFTTPEYEVGINVIEMPFFLKRKLGDFDLYAGPSIEFYHSSQYSSDRLDAASLRKADFTNAGLDLSIGASYTLRLDRELLSVGARYTAGTTEASDLTGGTPASVSILFSWAGIFHFWDKKNPAPGTPADEFETEYFVRRTTADSMFKESKTPGSETERGRVYILYGKPDDIIREDFRHDPFSLSDGTILDTYEIWLYDRPAGNTLSNNIFSDFYPGQMKFVFADFHFLGIYDQIYSTEPDEIVDPRIYYER